MDRSTPPHILNQKIISEGQLIPCMTNALVDVAPVAEHLPVATLSHGLERVLFKCVIYFSSNFSRLTDAVLVFIGYETRVQRSTTSLHG